MTGFAAPRPDKPGGSPLINALAEHADSKIDLLKVITRAARDVAIGFGKEGSKLMPWTACRLNKDIFFNGTP